VKSCISALAALLFVPGLCPANPVYEVIYSEVQTSPDSLERIELHPYNMYSPIDLSGFWLRTRSGTATVNQGVVIWNESSHVVLDRSNVTGVFSLGDESDSVVLYDLRNRPVGGSLAYPSTRGTPYDAPAPPPNTSASLYCGIDFPEPVEYFIWYIDSTPTFGLHNDDSIGGIYGRVFDADSHPLESVAVEAGGFHDTTDAQGGYCIRPLYRNSCVVRATKNGYAPGISRPVSVGVGVSVHDVDIYLTPVGLSEFGKAARPACSMVWRAGGLHIWSDVPTHSRILLADALGRVVWSSHVGLAAGLNRIRPNPAPAAGTYTAVWQRGRSTVRTRVVVR